jgi:predicted transcriptional regulator
MATVRRRLTPQELAIMKVVWKLGAPTVRDVYEALLRERHIAYTTVMTMMNILETKGHLKKEKSERAFRYRPARSERAVVGSLVRDFVNRVFDGAAQPLLLHLVRERKLSARERNELLALIKDAEP